MLAACRTSVAESAEAESVEAESVEAGRGRECRGRVFRGTQRRVVWYWMVLRVISVDYM